MKTKGHIIKKVIKGSIAEEMGLEPGDAVLGINGQEITDIFDYQYLMQDEYVKVAVLAKGGEECILEIEKEFGEDLGVEFENGLMDAYRSCCNKCIFCFIDQMPKGMRDTLYFKDDDSRLSFLQGNYVTLTNMSEHDIDRIIKYRLSPINISFQTTNPALRCMMLHNRFAGEALKKADRLYEAGIEMNGQIVLCKGINDGRELEKSISDLTGYLPHLTSVSVVPVGLSKYREGLYPLQPFAKEDAEKVIDLIEGWQKKIYAAYGLHFVHASDEWYILAERELPEAERYDGYLQLENGVGMLRLLLDEFQDAMEKDANKNADADKNKDKDKGRFGENMQAGWFSVTKSLGAVQEQESGEDPKPESDGAPKPESGEYPKQKEGENLEEKAGRTAGTAAELSLATGKLAYPYMKRFAEQVMERYPERLIHVYAITNEFFGEQITVSGLLTGRDIIRQLQGKPLGEKLLLPQNVLRSGDVVFLDDITLDEMEKTLQVPIDIVKSSGYGLFEAMRN